MVISEEVKPDKSLYVIGAQIIKLLKTEPLGVYDIYVLFDKFNQSLAEKERVSLSYFVYSVIWLYMLDLVGIGPNGDLIRCF